MPTVEQSVQEDALEIQDMRELGPGWAWFVNYLRAWSWPRLLTRNLLLRIGQMCAH